MPVAWVLVLSSFLFSVGIYGVLARRNAVLVLMSIELMLNAANINFVVFNLMLRSVSYIGQVFALFIITIAAAELGVGLAIVILIFRNRSTVSIDEVSLMKWCRRETLRLADPCPPAAVVLPHRLLREPASPQGPRDRHPGDRRLPGDFARRLL